MSKNKSYWLGIHTTVDKIYPYGTKHFLFEKKRKDNSIHFKTNEFSERRQKDTGGWRPVQPLEEKGAFWGHAYINALWVCIVFGGGFWDALCRTLRNVHFLSLRLSKILFGKGNTSQKFRSKTWLAILSKCSIVWSGDSSWASHLILLLLQNDFFFALSDVNFLPFRKFWTRWVDAQDKPNPTKL